MHDIGKSLLVLFRSMAAILFLCAGGMCAATVSTPASPQKYVIPSDVKAGETSNLLAKHPDGLMNLVNKLLPIIRSDNGYITLELLEDMLEIKLDAKPDGKGGFIADYESSGQNITSLNLHEYSYDAHMPLWMKMQGSMDGAYSILNISISGNCTSTEQVKAKLQSAGLVSRGATPYYGLVIDQLSDSKEQTKILIFSSPVIENFAPCVQSFRIEAARKGRIG